MSIVIEKKVLTKEELQTLHLLQQDFQNIQYQMDIGKGKVEFCTFIKH